MVRIDYFGGSSPGSEGQIIPFLIYGGYIRLLVPNEKEELLGYGFWGD